jgi:hypothetical protein
MPNSFGVLKSRDNSEMLYEKRRSQSMTTNTLKTKGYNNIKALIGIEGANSCQETTNGPLPTLMKWSCCAMEIYASKKWRSHGNNISHLQNEGTWCEAENNQLDKPPNLGFQNNAMEIMTNKRTQNAMAIVTNKRIENAQRFRKEHPLKGTMNLLSINDQHAMPHILAVN